MAEFDRTESKYLEHQILKKLKMPQIGEVVKVYEHTSEDDTSNFECDVKLRDVEQQKRGVPIAQPTDGTALVPEKGDMVVVSFLRGKGESPIVTNILYTNTNRAPLGKSGMIRQKKGNLYYEADSDGEWMRIARKKNDDDSGENADARVEIDDSGENPTINIDASGADININVSDGGTVKLGDPSGQFKPVARQGDSVSNGTIDEGSSDVQSS